MDADCCSVCTECIGADYRNPERIQLEQSEDTDILEILDKNDVTTRCYNCIKWSDIKTLRDLVGTKRNDILKFRNFGKKSRTELDELLEKLGFSWGMNTDIYPSFK